MKRLAVLLCAWVIGCSAAPAAAPVAARPIAPAAPAAPAPAPRPAPPPADEPARPTSEPYAGDLSIFEEPGRAERLQIERVMDLLGIRPGSAVADVGAGSGWFTVRAARRVGPDGVVYAVEINPRYLAHIAQRAEREELGNVRAVLGADDDPKLAPASVDAVLLLKTYHELQRPLGLMRRLHAALRPGGRVGIIDKHGQGDDHGLDEAVVVREVARAGFRLLERHDFVKDSDVEYFLVLERR